MKNNLVRPTAFILGFVILGLLSVSYASAQNEPGKYLPIVEKIAEKFSLNKDEVQAVFEEEREERHAEMQARFSERLDDLVNSGKISKEQKEAILKKHEEIHNQMFELKELDPEARREEMKKIHEEFKQWADEQGIDLPHLGTMKFIHKHGRGGFKGEFHEKFEVKLD